MPRLRLVASIVASLFVVATGTVTSLAAPKKPKSPSSATSASTTVKKSKKKKTKATAKATPSPAGSSVTTTSKPKDVPPSEQPPIELTGALPQAKLADKKPKEKSEKEAKDAADKGEAKDAKAKTDASKATGKEAVKEIAKEVSKEVAKEAKTSKETKKKLETAGVVLGSATRKAIGEKPKVKTCLHKPVIFSRLGQPDVSFVLTTCKGALAPGATDYLSVVGRPYDASPPPAWIDPVGTLAPASQTTVAKAEKTFSNALSEAKGSIPKLKRLDSGLVVRLQKIADHFPGKSITIVSGYRKQMKASLHKEGRALDVRIDGVTNESLVAFCKTLDDTGCGYYPNSYFVHVDVRGEGAGHVSWIDVSGPGETPRYVDAWPTPASQPKLPQLPAVPEKANTNTLTNELPPLPSTDRTLIGEIDDASTETRLE